MFINGREEGVWKRKNDEGAEMSNLWLQDQRCDSEVLKQKNEQSIFMSNIVFSMSTWLIDLKITLQTHEPALFPRSSCFPYNTYTFASTSPLPRCNSAIHSASPDEFDSGFHTQRQTSYS